MSADEYPHLELALPGFHRARELIKAAKDSISPFGFVGSKFDFYRFANRFRLVTCFQGLKLDGFTEETTSGYDALTRIFFAWSAFERYAEIANDRAPYRDGHDFSILTLAASIRHIFVHEILTAHPNGLSAENLSNISRSIGNFLIHFIQSDFSRRLTMAEFS